MTAVDVDANLFLGVADFRDPVPGPGTLIKDVDYGVEVFDDAHGPWTMFFRAARPRVPEPRHHPRYVQDLDTGLWARGPRTPVARYAGNYRPPTARELAAAAADHIIALVPGSAHVEVGYRSGALATKVEVTIWHNGRPRAVDRLGDLVTGYDSGEGMADEAAVEYLIAEVDDDGQ